MRAFVALIPPAAALDELAAALGPVRAVRPDLRWTPAAHWHLTLAFLGEIDEGVLPDLTARLARAARRHPQMDLALGGAGRFGDRVLWTRVLAAPTVAVPGSHELRALAGRVPRSGTSRSAPRHRRDPDDDLRALAASVGAAARRCRIAVDDRPYRPHVTLARARPGTELRPVVETLRGFAGTPWTADTLHLVRSRLGAGPGGTAAYEVIATWPLGRPTASPAPTHSPSVRT
jgi:2'-5' RNA ligase